MKLSPWIINLAKINYIYVVCFAIFVAIITESAADFWVVLLSQGAMFVALVVHAVQLALRPKDVSMGRVVALVTLVVIANIVCHGIIYSKVGLVSAAAAGDVVKPDLAIGLYFSIVTFTTLGYGDYVPTDGFQLVSALQALYGYMFLGSLVGLGVGTVVNR